MFSVIRNFNPIEFLKKEYNDKLDYNFWVFVAISKGHHKLVLDFLEKVPNVERKGTEDYNNHFFSIISLF